MKVNYIYQGDTLSILRSFPNDCIQTCITSPPYFSLRNYGVDSLILKDDSKHIKYKKGVLYTKDDIPHNLYNLFKQAEIGSEDLLEDYINNLLNISIELKRVLKSNGTFWLNLGDTYVRKGDKEEKPRKKTRIEKTDKGTSMHYKSIKTRQDLCPRNLIGVPWRVALALQNAGWILRQDIIYAKNNPKPESVKNRCVKSHEYIFLFSKQDKYYFDYKAIREKATEKPSKKRKFREFRNKRSVWTLNSSDNPFKHYATFPEKLVKPMVLAGSDKNDIVLDIFSGSGTTCVVAKENNRKYIGIDINSDYINIANKRLKGTINNLF